MFFSIHDGPKVLKYSLSFVCRKISCHEYNSPTETTLVPARVPTPIRLVSPEQPPEELGPQLDGGKRRKIGLERSEKF